MSKNNLKIKKEWVFQGIKTKEEARSITVNLFNNDNERPDAIFRTSDTLALGTINALKEMNINIPDDVGVVGYSNDTFSEIISPSLTSIEQSPQEIGSNAAKILINIIDSENVDHAKKSLVIKSKLIVRDSTKR